MESIYVTSIQSVCLPAKKQLGKKTQEQAQEQEQFHP